MVCFSQFSPWSEESGYRRPLGREREGLVSSGTEWSPRDGRIRSGSSNSKRADNAGSNLKSSLILFYLIKCIGDELQNRKAALLPSVPSPGSSTFLCLPGGFSAAATKHSPGAIVCETSLPFSQCGHKMISEAWISISISIF